MVGLVALVLSLDVQKQSQNQQTTLPAIHARELLPEGIPRGSCSGGYSGYLMYSRSGKDEYVDIRPEQIGQYVESETKKGYVLTIAPQESGRLFVMAECPSHGS